MIRSGVLALLVLLFPLLVGCRYSFVPLIPKPVEVNLPTRITQASLTRVDERLVVQAQIDGRFEPGFLSVQWFEGSRTIGSDSVYLDGALRQGKFELEAPEQGAYRAVLSFGGAVLRQLELYEVEP